MVSGKGSREKAKQRRKFVEETRRKFKMMCYTTTADEVLEDRMHEHYSKIEPPELKHTDGSPGLSRDTFKKILRGQIT